MATMEEAKEYYRQDEMGRYVHPKKPYFELKKEREHEAEESKVEEKKEHKPEIQTRFKGRLGELQEALNIAPKEKIKQRIQSAIVKPVKAEYKDVKSRIKRAIAPARIKPARIKYVRIPARSRKIPDDMGMNVFGGSSLITGLSQFGVHHKKKKHIVKENAVDALGLRGFI